METQKSFYARPCGVNGCIVGKAPALVAAALDGCNYASTTKQLIEEAYSIQTQESRLRALAKEPYLAVVMGVAGHPNVPPDLLEEIISNTKRDYFDTVVWVPRLLRSPERVQKGYSDAAGTFLKSMALTNKATPSDLVLRLLKGLPIDDEKMHEFLEIVSRRTDLCNELFWETYNRSNSFRNWCDHHNRIMINLMINPGCPVGLQDELVAHGGQNFRIAVAESSATSSRILRKLIAGSWFTPLATFAKQLLKAEISGNVEPELDVGRLNLAKAIIRHPNTTQDMLLDVAKKSNAAELFDALSDSDRLTDEIEAALSGREETVVMAIIAESKSMDDLGLLIKLCKDGEAPYAIRKSAYDAAVRIQRHEAETSDSIDTLRYIINTKGIPSGIRDIAVKRKEEFEMEIERQKALQRERQSAELRAELERSRREELAERRRNEAMDRRMSGNNQFYNLIHYGRNKGENW